MVEDVNRVVLPHQARRGGGNKSLPPSALNGHTAIGMVGIRKICRVDSLKV
jgi:hypothetical protein